MECRKSLNRFHAVRKQTEMAGRSGRLRQSEDWKTSRPVSGHLDRLLSPVTAEDSLQVVDFMAVQYLVVCLPISGLKQDSRMCAEKAGMELSSLQEATGQTPLCLCRCRASHQSGRTLCA
jgi:hypothetical protein